MNRELEPQLETEEAVELYSALAQIDWSTNIAKFLRDVLTIDELEEMICRFAVAKRFKKGMTVRAIAKELSISTTTVSRINYWLHHGMGGYKLALDKLE